MQPVLEISAADGFALWPVGEHESYGYLVLNGELTPAEVGTAVMQIADCNDLEPQEEHGPCPNDPLGTFLHGLLTTALYSAALVSTGGFGRPARAARKRGRAPVTLADRAGPQRDLYVFAVGRGARDRHRLHRSVRLDIQDSKNQPGGPTC